MKGARSQLLAGAALAENEHSRICKRNFRDQLVYLAHRRTLTHHVVLEIDVSEQSLVLAFEPFEMAGIFKGHRSDAGNCRHELQVIVVKMDLRLIRIQINYAERVV